MSRHGNMDRFRWVITVSLFALCFQQLIFAQNGKSKTPSIQNGNQPGVIAADTVLSMRMNDSLSSKTSHVGDRFIATVTVPVYADGKVAIPSGSTVEGKVTQLTPAKRLNKGGSLAVEFEEITLPNGLSTKIDGVLTSDDPEIQKRIDDENRMSGGRSKDTAIFVGQSGAIGAVLGGITGGAKGAIFGGAVGAGVGLGSVLFSKGEEASVPAGTTFGIRLKQALPVPDDIDVNADANLNNSQKDNSIPSSDNNTNPTGDPRTKPINRESPDKDDSTGTNGIPSNSKTDEISKTSDIRKEENQPENIPETDNLPLSSPEMVRKAQQALKDKGYYEGDINGEMTPRTQSALKIFQHENHLPETGLLDIDTANGLKLIGRGAHNQPRLPASSNSDTGNSSRPLPSQPNKGGNNSPSPLPEISQEYVQNAANIRSLAANLLAEYQQLIGAKMTDNGVEFENNSRHNDGDIDLLFAIDSFSNAANLYSRMAPSLRTTSSMRNATLSLAREARRTDKVFTTTSSHWTNQLSAKWDNIRQSVLKIMSAFNINVTELDN